MRKPILVFALALLLPAVSLAGIVKGTLWYKGRPIGKGVKIEVRHGSSVYSTVTDEHGRFRLIVGEVGSCRLYVRGRTESPSISIVSRKNTVTYELELVVSEGTYELREKK